MNRCLVRLAPACGWAAVLVLSGASCSLPQQTRDEPVAAPSPVVRPAPRRIVQLSYGRDAHFASCTPPACPTVTPKTLTRPLDANLAPVAMPPAGPGAEPADARPLVQPLIPVATPTTPGEPAARMAPAAAKVVVRPPDAPGVAEPPRAGRALDAAAEEIRVTVTFPLASAALTDSAKRTLRRTLPQAFGADRIVIAGRTDNVGSDEINRQLALARAHAVRDYLHDVEPGLPGVIAIDAKGSCCFVAANDSEDGRSRNRRVDVVFLSSGAH